MSAIRGRVSICIESSRENRSVGVERNMRPIEQDSPLLLPTMDEDRWAANLDAPWQYDRPPMIVPEDWPTPPK